MVPHPAKYWDFLSFPDFKAGQRCSRLRWNRMMRGGRKCIVGQRWDYGGEERRSAWDSKDVLTAGGVINVCVCGNFALSDSFLQHVFKDHVFSDGAVLKLEKQKKNCEWDDMSLKMYICKTHGARRPKRALGNNLYVMFPVISSHCLYKPVDELFKSFNPAGLMMSL